jgi:HxlR-like helix-turn-helix
VPSAGPGDSDLADRLRELADQGVVHRFKLPPPAASTVYGLTDHGRDLEPVLDALGTWGIDLPVPAGQPTLSPTSALVYLRGCLRLHPDPLRGVFRVELDDRVWTVRCGGDDPVVEAGEADSPDAGIATDPHTLNTLLADPSGLDAALASGVATTSGSRRALRRLLKVAS